MHPSTILSDPSLSAIAWQSDQEPTDESAPLWMRAEAQEESSSPHVYRVAGRTLCSSAALPELAPFAAPPVGRPESDLLPLDPAGAGQQGMLLFDAPGELAGGVRRVRCELFEWGYRIEAERCGTLRVAASGEEVRHRLAPGLAAARRAELLLGPGLILALALREVFCLHASAVVRGGRVAAFIGDSGRGKSTLAHQLGRRPQFRLAADDVLPIRVGRALEALPSFPQLKLPAGRQPGNLLPQRLALDAIFLLAGGASRSTVEARRLAPRQALEFLIRHTVAARLFAPDLLALHLHAFSALARRLPVYDLRYPWRPDAVGAVGELVHRRLEATETGARPR